MSVRVPVSVSVIALALSVAHLGHADDTPVGAVAPPASDIASAVSGPDTQPASSPVTAPATPPTSSSAVAPPRAASPSAPRGASSALQLETTQITGNRELPKVMVIVPWKSAEPAELAGRPINSLVEEILTPIDRDVMRRTLGYYRLLAPGAAPGDDVSQAADIDTTDQ